MIHQKGQQIQQTSVDSTDNIIIIIIVVYISQHQNSVNKSD